MRISVLAVFTLLALLPLHAQAQSMNTQAVSAQDSTALAPSLPSGQGTFLYGPAAQPASPGMEAATEPSPTPLYVPGISVNTPRQVLAAPAWAVSPQGQAGEFPPFGANLFQGHFASTYYEGVNPEYVIMPGDRIQVNIWGAHSFNSTLMVDQQGNIFLPEVGPFRVAGMTNASLLPNVRRFLSATFRTNVEIYANLLTAQPVAIYVTGFVNRPGRYAGGKNDSILHYLDKAGGILAERGSYRDIAIKRGNKVMQRVDLYAFILSGALPGGALRDGDVIVVGPKGDSITACGIIPQHAMYESKGVFLKGDELIRLASPLPAASHASVSGTRNSEPFHVYLPLDSFSKFMLANGDRVEFLADRPGTGIMVNISGSMLGATRYPVSRSTTLRDVLAYVPIDPNLSNLDGIYLKRKSVADQQRKALLDAVRRLENSVLTASSATQEGAAIRVQEAQLVQNFAMRVANLEPEGVVVVTKKGATADITLEDGDEIVIPQKSDVVQINGEVMMPKAVVHDSKADLAQYISDAGGFTDRANKKYILVVHPNGEVAPVANSRIQAGDMLLVLPEYDSKSFSVFKDIMQVIYQVAISTGVLLAL